jgi:cytochrome P450
MIATDPPRHRKLRSLVTQAFTPKAVENLALRIEEIVQETLDPVTATGKIDVISDLATPLPVTVIAEMLGIPAADRTRFKQWSDYVVGVADFRGDFDPAKFRDQTILDMASYFFGMLEQRRQQPGNDLISGLVAANIEGETLSEIELLGFCALLLVAGNETTTNLIGNALKTFTENPGSWEDLRAHPDLLPSAIEEVLRYRSPVQSMFRVAKNDTQLEGKQIPAGETVMAWIGSANHDEAQFPQADSFDIRRNPNRHLAFGQGIHYCLGAPLARLEAKIALSEMLARFKSVRRDLDAPIDRLPSLIVYGVRNLPIQFEEA